MFTLKSIPKNGTIPESFDFNPRTGVHPETISRQQGEQQWQRLAALEAELSKFRSEAEARESWGLGVGRFLELAL